MYPFIRLQNKIKLIIRKYISISQDHLPLPLKYYSANVNYPNKDHSTYCPRDSTLYNIIPGNYSFPLGYLLYEFLPHLTTPPTPFFILRLFSLSWVYFICTQCSESKKVFKIFIPAGTKVFPPCLIPSGHIKCQGPVNTVARIG